MDRDAPFGVCYFPDIQVPGTSLEIEDFALPLHTKTVPVLEHAFTARSGAVITALALYRWKVIGRSFDKKQ